LEVKTSTKQWITKRVVEAPRKEDKKEDERRNMSSGMIEGM
jgi:hypothetical protein